MRKTIAKAEKMVALVENCFWSAIPSVPSFTYGLFFVLR